MSLGTGNKVNKGIARTLRNNPEEFFFLHNGITAICSSIKIADGTMRVKELNVVNGCQSLSTIFNCSESVRNASDAYITEIKRELDLLMYDAPNAVKELKQPVRQLRVLSYKNINL